MDLRATGETDFYDDANKTFVTEDAYITFDAKIGYQTGDWDFYDWCWVSFLNPTYPKLFWPKI